MFHETNTGPSVILQGKRTKQDNNQTNRKLESNQLD